MDIIDLGYFLSDFGSVIIFILCLLFIRAMPFQEKRLRFLFAYYCSVLAVHLAGQITRQYGNNIYLSYIISPAYLVLLTLFLTPEKSESNARFITLSAMSVGLLFLVYEAFFVPGGITNYNSLSSGYSAVFLGILCLRKLLRMRNEENQPLSKSPMYWVVLGLTFHSFGSSLSFIFYRTMQPEATEALMRLLISHMISGYICYVLLIVGLWKFKATKGS